MGLHGSLMITKTVPESFPASPQFAAEAPFRRWLERIEASEGMVLGVLRAELTNWLVKYRKFHFLATAIGRIGLEISLSGHRYLIRFQDRCTQAFCFPTLFAKARKGWGTDAMGIAIEQLP
jgi:hypothetical protein